MEAITKGDVVTLKSGGPKMTVVTETHSGLICAWFDGTEAKHATFSAESLEKI